MKAKAILNPFADHGRAIRFKEKILAWGNEFTDLGLSLTEKAGDGKKLAREAVENGYDLIISAGGDGTVHEIINGIGIQENAQATLGIISIGSANDYAFGLGLSHDPKEALQDIFLGQTKILDLARIEDDHKKTALVGNGIGIGIDATINNQAKSITFVHGLAMYTLAALKTITFYYQTPQLEVYFDDVKLVQKALLLAIGIGPRVGGGFHLTPQALFDDGLLDSCTVNPVSRATMFYMLPKVMRGTHITSKHVTMRRSKNIVIHSNLPLPVHVDGETFASPENEVHGLEINTLPASLSVKMPA